jgi:alanine racemase
MTTSSAFLTIDLDALADNYRLFQQKVGPGCSVAGLVKADAYGLGLAPVVEKLLSLGCPQFFVATIEEALRFRAISQDAPIAVLGGLFKGAEKEYLANNIRPVLNSPDDIARWQAVAKDVHRNVLPAVIHVDTGMNRLGLSREEAIELIENPQHLEGLSVDWVMSHFACADEKGHPLTPKQAEAFDRIAESFPGAKRSLGNSPGLFRDTRFHTDMVRPGYALYGGNPTPEAKNPMKPVVSLKARVLQVRHCKKGESIGYGAGHVFDKDTVTATLGVGYADGFLRSASNWATLYYNDQPCPVIGRVSMDLTTIDIDALKGRPTQGDFVEILGENQGVDELANAAGTIGYEILTSLGPRYTRHYVGAVS